MSNLLITGGAGFIGANFVRYWRERHADDKIIVLDALTYAGNRFSLDGIADVSFVHGDIRDGPLVMTLLREQGIDTLVHFAAESHVDRSIESATEFVRTNVLGTQVLLNNFRASGCGRFVHVSTDEVYGSLGPTGRFVETTPLDPTSPYAASKAASDLMVLAGCKTHGLDAVVTRCTNNYGPYQFPEKLIPLFITNAYEDKNLPLYGDGMNVRSWLYVTDHCEALLAVGEKGKSGEVYNIGGAAEAEIPNAQVTSAILKALDKPDTLIQKVGDRPAHDRRYAIDYAKINRELGWSPRTSFEHGLQQTIDWYLGNQQWWKSIKAGEYLNYYERNYSNR
ncbi:MAG: dTDP-glucose 4,6-dehydratase [Bdellovibrionales bacterium]|nr:dTDP-glucose 4,6-dehydratase [Bdellovibrionales bacterium]